MVLLQNTLNGSYSYIGVDDFVRNQQVLADQGVFPVGQQYDQTKNPFLNPPLPPGKELPPGTEAGAFSEVTQGDIFRERMIDFTADVEDRFERIKSKLFDFSPPNKRKKTIRIPIEVPGGESLSPIRNSTDSDTTDINNSDFNIKLKDLYRSIRN